MSLVIAYSTVLKMEKVGSAALADPMYFVLSQFLHMLLHKCLPHSHGDRKYGVGK